MSELGTFTTCPVSLDYAKRTWTFGELYAEYARSHRECAGKQAEIDHLTQRQEQWQREERVAAEVLQQYKKRDQSSMQRIAVLEQRVQEVLAHNERLVEEKRDVEWQLKMAKLDAQKFCASAQPQLATLPRLDPTREWQQDVRRLLGELLAAVDHRLADTLGQISAELQALVALVARERSSGVRRGESDATVPL